MFALLTQISAEVLASSEFELEFSKVFQSSEQLKSGPTKLFVSLSSQSIFQIATGSIVTSLNQYIEENQEYFDNYALGESNKIGSGNAIWEAASLNFDASSGGIILDLEGIALLPFPASLFYSNPEMRLKLFFNPDKCLQYSYSGHTLEVGGDLEAVIRSEVSALLGNSAGDIETSLNNEVEQSLRNLQLLDDIGCWCEILTDTKRSILKL